MPSISFSGAVLLACHRTSKEATLSFSAELTQGVAKKLEWGEPDEKAIGAKMEGSLNSGTIVMVPKQGELFSKSEFQADFQSIGHFQIVRRELEQSRGMGHRRELRFQVKSVAADVASFAESWLVTVKDGKATLKATYSIKSSGAEPEAEEEGGEDE